MVFSKISCLHIVNPATNPNITSDFVEVKLDLLVLKDNVSKLSETLKDKKNGKTVDEIIIITSSELSELINKKNGRKSNPLMLNFEEYN